MGQCYGKDTAKAKAKAKAEGEWEGSNHSSNRQRKSNSGGVGRNGRLPKPLVSASPLPQFYSPQPSPIPSIGTSPARSTPGHRLLRRPFPPPSPAKHIQTALRRRLAKPTTTKGKETPSTATVPNADGDESTTDEPGKALNKHFGYSKNFVAKYELGLEVGRGHFGHTCAAIAKKGDIKGQPVAVKIISKAKMTTPISIEDVRREVKILKALSGHRNVVRFYDACEDEQNVYIVMELCEGGELLERIISRGGRYSEEDAKVIVVQILNIVSFCHLQGVVHRDLKPENFLFSTRDENSLMKAIDFGLSDFIKPDERLNDVVGSAYYVAPEVLQRSYSTEADVWSVGVITYILLCGSRPFWARTETGIFRSVVRADPSFDEAPWPSVSPQAKSFVKRLLHKDLRKRMTAAQALAHPWLRGDQKIPLDILVYRMVKAYLRSSLLKQTALKALARNLSENEVFYLRAQFTMLEPTKDGRISLENFKQALSRNATEAMKEARIMEILKLMDALAHKKMDFQEFCAAAISVHQLEANENWEQHARTAYADFDREGNRVVGIDELAREVNLSATVPAHIVLHDWVRHTDGKLSFTGFVKLLHGVTIRPNPITRMN